MSRRWNASAAKSGSTGDAGCPRHGGLIGLRWACDHPQAVGGLVITNTGFFPDHEWIEIAVTMRTPIQGEALLDSLSRKGFDTLLEAASSEFDEPRLTSTGRRSPPLNGGA